MNSCGVRGRHALKRFGRGCVEVVDAMRHTARTWKGLTEGTRGQAPSGTGKTRKRILDRGLVSHFAFLEGEFDPAQENLWGERFIDEIIGPRGNSIEPSDLPAASRN